VKIGKPQIYAELLLSTWRHIIGQLK